MKMKKDEEKRNHTQESHTSAFTDLGVLLSFCTKILQLTVEMSEREQVRDNSETSDNGLVFEQKRESLKQKTKKESLSQYRISGFNIVLLA